MCCNEHALVMKKKKLENLNIKISNFDPICLKNELLCFRINCEGFTLKFATTSQIRPLL